MATSPASPLPLRQCLTRACLQTEALTFMQNTRAQSLLQFMGPEERVVNSIDMSISPSEATGCGEE